MPRVQAIYDDYASQGYVALAINLWEDMETVVKPKAGTYTYQFLRDGGAVWNVYKQNSLIPLNYVIDPNGVVRYWEEGFSESTIRQVIQQWLPVPYDAGVTRIMAPSGMVDSGTSVTPACSVYNYGTNTASYPVRMKIGDGYDLTAQVTSQAPGARLYVTFPNWSAIGNGTLAISCSTELTSDGKTSNDKQTGSVQVRIPADVGCRALLVPSGAIDSGVTVTPACSVYNYGLGTRNYPVRMKIGPYYEQTATVSGHQSGAALYVTFQPWLASRIGSFTVTCSTELAGDVQPGNDKATGSVVVQRSAPPNLGWTKKADVTGQPSGKNVKGGSGITALGGDIYLILGNNTLDFMKYSIAGNAWTALPPGLPVGPKNKKVKKGAYIVDDESAVYAFKGGGTNEFYRYDPGPGAWTTLSEPGFTNGLKGGFACLAEVGGEKYVYAGSGSNSPEWKRFKLSTQAWEAAAPATLPVLKAKVGSGLACDGAGKLYFLLGGGKANDLYTLDLTAPTPTWAAKTALPLQVSGGKKKKVKEGGCIDYYGGKFYAVKGGNTKEFWSYDPGPDAWAYVGEVGGGAPFKGIKCGRSLTATASGIYCIIGNNTNEFWLYGVVLGSQPPLSERAEQTSASASSAVNPVLRIFPNPCKGAATIAYSLPRATNARLRLYDASGKLVAFLGEGAIAAGSHTTCLDVRNLAEGIYVLRLETPVTITTEKLIIE